MNAASRRLRELYRRFFAGRRDLWLSGLLLALTSAAGTAVAVRTLYEFRSCLSLLLFAAVTTGALAGWLWMMIRRLNARVVDQQRAVQTQRAVAGFRFAECNLILAAGLLAIVTGLLLVCGTSWLVLAMLAGAVASVCVLVLGSLPGTPLNALVLCPGPVARRQSFEHWPGEVLLFERQRRLRLEDSASDRPRLEELRDTLDAERAGLDPRDIRLPTERTLVEELPGRLFALIWPGGIAAAMAAVILLLLAPADWSLAGPPPESPSGPPDSSTSDPPSSHSGNPSANPPNNSGSDAGNQNGDSGGGTGGGRGSSKQGGREGGANPRPGPGSSSAGGNHSGPAKNPNGSGSSSGGGNSSRPGGSSRVGASKRASESGLNPDSSGAKPTADSPVGSGKQPAGGTKKGGSQTGQAKTPRPTPGQAPTSPTRNQRGSKKSGSGGAGTSGSSTGKQNLKPGPRRNAPPAPPSPPGQGPVTHIRFSGGTQVDGQPLDLPQGAGSGKASDADAVRRSSTPEPVRLPPDSRPIQIPAFPLRKR